MSIILVVMDCLVCHIARTYNRNCIQNNSRGITSHMTRDHLDREIYKNSTFSTSDSVQPKALNVNATTEAWSA